METFRHIRDKESSVVSEVSTYLPDVDEAWPELIQASTVLCDSVAASGSEMDGAFQEVVERAIAIFRREESSMEMSLAPRADVHRQGHLAALTTLSRLRRVYRENGGSPELALRTRTELLDFLKHHHILLDAMLGRHIRDWSGKSGEYEE